MKLTKDDVEQMFITKCKKYPVEKLTEELKDILFVEAINEARNINLLNNRSVKND